MTTTERGRRYRALVRRHGERCVACSTTTNLTIDHIIPRSRGGSNRLENLQLLCAPCNHAKGDTLDERDVKRGRVRRGGIQTPTRAPKVKSSRHLPECDGVYCMFGCPVFHGLGFGEQVGCA